jgi:HlyD family secretion protein
MADAHPSAVSAVASLAVLLDLSRRARQAKSVVELGFLLVNETRHLVRFRQAALWHPDEGIQTLSGVLQPEANAPYVQWLERLAHHLTGDRHARALDASALPDALAAEWAEWWPTHALWLPLPGGSADRAPGLLLARDEPWTPAEQQLLREWLEGWAHARSALQPDRPPGWRGQMQRLRTHLSGAPGQARWRQARWRWLALALLLPWLPVRLTVMAPGELVPAHPVTVRAPLDGVLEVFHVQPNQSVERDQPLFGLDPALIQNRVAVAAQVLSTAEAEYRQAAQQALTDPRSKVLLALLPGKIEEKRAELSYLQDQVTRAGVRAPQAGVVLIDDPSEWIGRPVATGERILRIAAPDDREVEAWLPIGDAIPLDSGAAVRLYLSASPLSPVSAHVRYVAHDAVQRPDGGFAYRLRATIDGPTDQRVGLKGTARIDGGWSPLGYWVLRRPLASLRSTVGL